MAKSEENCKGGCKISKPVAKVLLSKELAKWKRQAKKQAGKTDLMQAATGGVLGTMPDPPVTQYECMSDWYRARMAATEIDRLDAEAARIEAALDAEEAKLSAALESLAICVGGVMA